MDLQTVIQLIVSGLTIGCVYSLAGLGFALTLRATELINSAPGEMVVLGALIGYTLLAALSSPFIVAFGVGVYASALLVLTLDLLFVVALPCAPTNWRQPLPAPKSPTSSFRLPYRDWAPGRRFRAHVLA